jgi:hypothetical protein
LLNFFANDLNIISENQAGFRKGYSTVDNIFVLHALIDLYFSFGKKLYCTFKSFKNIEKRKGSKFSPCHTPVREGKNSD